MPYFAPEIFYPLGTILLGFAIAYGIYRTRSRGRKDPRIEEATRRLYEKADK